MCIKRLGGKADSKLLNSIQELQKEKFTLITQIKGRLLEGLLQNLETEFQLIGNLFEMRYHNLI